MGRTIQAAAASKPEKLKSFRRRMGLKQWALADMLDVDQATVSRWESGKSPIDDGVWLMLAETMRYRNSTLAVPDMSAGLDSDEHWPALLRRYRAMKNITQEQLSEMLGCTAASVSRWERGLFKPNLGTLTRLRNVVFFGRS